MNKKRITAIALSALISLNLTACSMETDEAFAYRIEEGICINRLQYQLINLDRFDANNDNMGISVSCNLTEPIMNRLCYPDDGAGLGTMIDEFISVYDSETVSLKPKDFNVGVTMNTKVENSVRGYNAYITLDNEPLIGMDAVQSLTNENQVMARIADSQWGTLSMPESVGTTVPNFEDINYDIKQAYLQAVTNATPTNIIRGKKHAVSVGTKGQMQPVNEYSYVFDTETTVDLITTAVEGYAKELYAAVGESLKTEEYAISETDIINIFIANIFDIEELSEGTTKDKLLAIKPELSVRTLVHDDKLYGREYSIKYVLNETPKAVTMGYNMAVSATEATAVAWFNGELLGNNSIELNGTITENILSGDITLSHDETTSNLTLESLDINALKNGKLNMSVKKTGLKGIDLESTTMPSFISVFMGANNINNETASIALDINYSRSNMGITATLNDADTACASIEANVGTVKDEVYCMLPAGVNTDIEEIAGTHFTFDNITGYISKVLGAMGVEGTEEDKQGIATTIMLYIVDSYLLTTNEQYVEEFDEEEFDALMAEEGDMFEDTYESTALDALFE